MNRLIGWLVAALVVAIFLPTLADYATEAIPVLVSLLVALVLFSLVLPPRRGRGR